MTRLISGTAGGRTLRTPSGEATRPTSGRAREGLFSTLEALVGLDGARVLDLYAGSGAVGLEALSRGATSAVLVESDPAALSVIHANVRALGPLGAQIVASPVERFLAGSPPAEGFDVAFLDPPYVVDAGPAVRALTAAGWLTPGAVVVVERATRSPAWIWPDPLAAHRSRRYGEATLWYGRAP